MGAEHALLHGAAAVGHGVLGAVGGEGGAGRVLRLLPVELADPVRTGGHAHAAADASLVVDEDHAFLVVIGGAHGADFGAGGVLALHAGAGQEEAVAARALYFEHLDPFLTLGHEVLGVASL